VGGCDQNRGEGGHGMRRSTLLALGVLLLGLVAIGKAPQHAFAEGDEPGINKITQVHPGMTMLEVLRTLGPPNDIVGHTFFYKDKGKVLFASDGSPLDKTKVEKIEASPIQNPVP
jgi:hypothetical protein